MNSSKRGANLELSLVTSQLETAAPLNQWPFGFELTVDFDIGGDLTRAWEDSKNFVPSKLQGAQKIPDPAVNRQLAIKIDMFMKDGAYGILVTQRLKARTY